MSDLNPTTSMITLIGNDLNIYQLRNTNGQIGWKSKAETWTVHFKYKERNRLNAKQ